MTVGIVFPGQGSQFVGMLNDISGDFPEVRTLFAEASEVLSYDLWQLVLNGPAEELDKTVHTQPALLAASYAIWRIIETRTTFQPALFAGHSLGEYSALVCAKALTFSDAIKIVAARGLYMQDASPVGRGALAAIVGLENDTVQELCEKAKLEKDILSPANFNSPGQVVIAGDTAAVERALILAKEAGARLAKLLPVSVPSHCILMKPAAERLMHLLEQININVPVTPVVNNVDVTIYESAKAIREGLQRQLYMPVRWVETIQLFVKKGVTDIVECGPGKVLNGLNKRIAPEVKLTNTSDLPSLQTLLGTVFES